MKRSYVTFFFYIFAVLICKAQQPQLSGEIKIVLSKGLVQCDLKLSNLPSTHDYSILLNSGFNIEYFRDSTDTYNYYFEKYYNNEQFYESFQYYLPSNNGKTRFLPKSFKIKYSGAFPIVIDTLKASNDGDWKGNIAINSHNIRMTEQSCWYPVIYNLVTDTKLSAVTYDLNINCEDCNAIYINGSIPVASNFVKIKSDKPYDLILFAGDYKIDSCDKAFFLNSSMKQPEFERFGSITKEIKSFYEKKTQISYLDNITFIETSPVSKRNGFLFVTYPTITSVGWDNGFEQALGSRGNWFKPFLAHELGHYYFGNYFKPNSTISQTLEESFSEFLSLEATKSIFGDSVYNKKIQDNLTALNNIKVKPISKIKSSADITNDQVYNYIYFPMILIAIKEEVGEEKMWKWIQLILTQKAAHTDYAFLKFTLESALLNEKQVNHIMKRYLESNNSIKNLSSFLQTKN